MKFSRSFNPIAAIISLTENSLLPITRTKLTTLWLSACNLSGTCRLFRHIGLHAPLLCWINMQIADAQIPLFAKKQIAEETLQIDG